MTDGLLTDADTQRDAVIQPSAFQISTRKDRKNGQRGNP